MIAGLVLVEGDLGEERGGDAIHRQGAALWLLHGPTTVLVVLLAGVAALSRGRSAVLPWLRAGLIAAALTAWHWLPMLQEMSLVRSAPALKGGIFAARTNLLGHPAAHAPGLNLALSAAGVALLLVVLVEGWQRTDPLRAALVTLCVGLASPLAAPLWSAASPLSWLQFPWRWLLPAVLLTLRPLAQRTPASNPRSWILGTLWLAPLLLLPLPPVTRAPELGPADGWRAAGSRLQAVIGSNPRFVDVPEHRPPWFREVAPRLRELRGLRAAVLDGAGTVRVTGWAPLDRRVELTLSERGRVLLRLLDYPWWEVLVDGRPVPVVRETGLVEFRVPAGDHTVHVRWRGNPLSRAGLALTLAGLAGLWLLRRREGPRA